ncbi:hypothetical protein P153DRAFT_388932 [Dothidotthia symphoricarpi CBS 119687]|uniref:Uncharacterized protein n=1 Tax=Dothidotthia symphoricarpi CBS 119687 TaxID=1392245 RepID=A0A6A6A3Q9_9PLEO|nr:uncharacterized protein P153DRAFT_388932 [Dothidotthia symphoricarpi CBS 119687]KAF2126186.1 hypothetical protein P153DRAFT_388932 [Dothidotthia symphoricarpi CBS 119687]
MLREFVELFCKHLLSSARTGRRKPKRAGLRGVERGRARGTGRGVGRERGTGRGRGRGLALTNTAEHGTETPTWTAYAPNSDNRLPPYNPFAPPSAPAFAPPPSNTETTDTTGANCPHERTHFDHAMGYSGIVNPPCCPGYMPFNEI